MTNKIDQVFQLTESITIEELFDYLTAAAFIDNDSLKAEFTFSSDSCGAVNPNLRHALSRVPQSVIIKYFGYPGYNGEEYRVTFDVGGSYSVQK